ncbi:hypothetical protein GCM10010531_37540 [Blastococcus jejuensis]|uniref:Cupredoxin-like domain-containing protein n=1 Tax=Blastococcus jejuensis TaxID=351224 RepID=A0ABP6PJ76_9ACTN
MTHRRLLAALLVGGLLVAGCAGTDPDTAAGSPAPSSTSSSSSSSPAASPTEDGQRIEVEVAGGQVTGDTGRVPVAAGEHVTLSITSDVADEVHVHGYDLDAELVPGTPAELTFDATIPGVFEVELHESGTVLLTLQVS